MAAEEEDEVIDVVIDDEMGVEDALAGGCGMTAEEEAEAARLVEAELAAMGEDEVEVLDEEEAPAEAAAEAVAEVEVDPEAGEEELEIEIEAEGGEAEAEVVELEIDAEEAEAPVAAPEAPAPAFVAAPPRPWVQAQRPPLMAEAAAGAGRKGKGHGKDMGKGQGKGKGKGDNQFFGLVHQVGEKTGNMLIKSWKVTEKYGQEAMIPKMSNPSGAKLGDKIAFEVLERPNGGRPIAVNISIRGHVDIAAEDAGFVTEMRRQVLYYLSDDNLRGDKFFQDIIASSEGGWISMTTIIGCPRMKQMRATCEQVFEAVRGAAEIELREEPGQEAIRRTTPPPPLVAKGKGQAKGAGGAPAQAAQAAGGAGAAGGKAGPCEELYYAGTVKAAGGKDSNKYFIQCDEISKTFGRDAVFWSEDKPAGVQGGSLVVFTVPATSEIGFSPQASFVARLAPLGGLGRQDGGAIAPVGHPGGKGMGLGVQRTIQKKGGPRG